MAVKYVKDFFFGPMTSVQRYAKGGHVTKVPAKAKPAAKGMPARAKPNAPAKGAKRMESPPKMGKGQGYKDGGKVPGKQMDRQPTKTPPGREKDLAPAKPFKGAYEGYAKGGKARRYAEGGDTDGDTRAARIMPGDGSPLDAGAPRTMKTFDYSEPSRPISLNQYGEYDPYGDRPVRDISVSPYEGRMSDPYAGLPEVRYLPVQTDEDRARMVLDKYAPERGGKSIEPAFGPGPERDFSESMRRNEERMRNDAAQQMRDLAEIQRQTGSYSPANPDSAAYQALTGNRPVGPEVLPRPGIDFKVPTRPYDPGVVEPLLEPSPYRPVDELMRGEPQMYKAAGPGPSIAYEDPAYYQEVVRQMQAERNEPAMARAVQNVGAGRPVGRIEIARAARAARAAQPQQQIPTPYMPQLRPTTREESDAYMRSIGGTPSPLARFAKGGKVGQAKVGKVMGEYKRGELHSGSKKGPLVKNPKQAIAIALSEARKSGAKIPKKADGGMMASTDAYGDKKEPYRGPPRPKSVTVTKVTKTVSDAKDAALNEKKMLEFLRSLPKDEIADMMEKRAMQAPSMDPDMPKYRKGGMARKGVPVHKGKAMYGGGKC